MNQPLLVTATQKAGPKITIAVGAVILVLLLALPLLSLLSPISVFHVSAYTLTLVGKILCYAIVALALDLVWGYAGLLSLGHGLFFALGGYAMGMYLMRQASGDGLPAFMTFLSWTELPWYWTGTSSFLWSMCLVVLATARGLGGKQHATGEFIKEAGQCGQWLSGLGFDGQVWQISRREALATDAGFHVLLTGNHAWPVLQASEAVFHRQEQLGGWQ